MVILTNNYKTMALSGLQLNLYILPPCKDKLHHTDYSNFCLEKLILPKKCTFSLCQKHSYSFNFQEFYQ